MPQYQWEGTTAKGEFKMGVLEGRSEKEIERKLKEMQIIPSKIKKKPIEIHIKNPFGTGIKTKSIVIFTRQLATMIDAGLPLVQCLDILGQQEPNIHFQKVIFDVKASVESGNTFAESLKKHPKVFDDLFVNLVAAGEMGGVLDSVLNRLADYAEKAEKLRRKVKSALKYPATVMVVAIGITIFLLVKVIPTFEHLFKSMGKAKLPEMTQFVMKISKLTVNYLPIVLLILAGIIFSIVMFLKTTFGRRLFDRMLLGMPILGVIVKKASIAKFTRTLGTLLASGVPILDALEIVAKTSGNKIIEEAVMYTRDKISEGKSIAIPLIEKGIFPRMVVQMIAVGESTGAMDIMLNKIADFYEAEVDTAVDSLTSLIEPLIMILIGGIVGFVLVSMYLPIFKLADVIKSD